MSSSRRTSGEIHILAMLDGKATGPLSRHFLALPAVFWYAAAGLGVCVLLATLAWLAHTSAPSRARDTDAAEVSLQPSPSAPAPQANAPADGADHAVLVVTDMPQSGKEWLPEPVHGAKIVDLPATPSPASAAPDLPAIRSAPPPRTAATPRLDTRVARTTPGRAHGSHAASVPGPAPRTQPQAAARAERADRAALHASASKAAALHPAAPHRATSTPTVPAPRARRPTAPGPVDTDVALISAIIQHTGTQTDAPAADAAVTCAGRNCGPRMPNHQ